ncbi:MAG: dihydroneopterin aldolase [Proteobacteria bacterium]|nr:dihydroneopterin aldolase [Pseudomonadota bacterium]
MDKVFINQLQLETIIGIHDWEREKAQVIILDIEITCNTKSAVLSDNIDDCIDYFAVCERLKLLADEHCYQLVESFAEEVSRIILEEFSAPSVIVKLSKPDAVKEAAGVGIIIERQKEK